MTRPTGALTMGVRHLVRRLWHLPCKLMLATIVLCLALREWYPFSPFPMYANFGPSAWYICVTDADGRPLPAAPYFGLDATIFRRMFETRVLARVAAGDARDRAEAVATQDMLEALVRDAHRESRRRLPDRIGLQRVALSLDGERVLHTQEMLAVYGAE